MLCGKKTALTLSVPMSNTLATYCFLYLGKIVHYPWVKLTNIITMSAFTLIKVLFEFAATILYIYL